MIEKFHPKVNKMMRLVKTGMVDGRWVAAILALSAGLAFSQPAPLADFDAYVADAVREWQVPGLAIAIVKDGQVVFAKGYDHAEVRHALMYRVFDLYGSHPLRDWSADLQDL